MSGDFTPEQKRYLEGFTAGLQIARGARGLAPAPAGTGAPVATEPTGPDAAHLRAQDRAVAAACTTRNVTGAPTAGIDPQELIDTRPYARAWHFHILNDRSLYGLPRKFNVGFDGGGIIPVLEDTNDIGFQAVEVKDGFGIEAGIWFRLLLGGITGHQTFGHGTGVVVKPAEATKVADAVVRVFIDHGDRTNRAKARLKYVIDAWGIDKFLSAMEEKLGCKLTRTPAEAIAPRPDFDRTAHVGAHPQNQPDLTWT